MKRMFFCFLLGAGAGATGHWYLTQGSNRAQLESAGSQVVSSAGRMATNLKSRFGELSETSVEAVKDELARTGTVVREKARAAGQSIADAAANTRVAAAVKARLVAEPGVSAFSINVDATDGLVTLSGRVASHEQIAKAVKIALDTEGVHKVISTLQVGAK